jgi:hypothetical protein
MVFWSRQDAVRANKQGPHWRHLHQQGSAACSIFLQGLPGRVPLAALCSAALLGSSWLLLTLTGMLAGVGKGAPGALCVALSQIRPLQHHPVRMPNLHREQLRNLQRALVIVPGVGGGEFASGRFPSSWSELQWHKVHRMLFSLPRCDFDNSAKITALAFCT